MANIQHSTVTDPNIHEPKGASTASVDTVYVSTGVGSGQWKKLPATALGTTGATLGSTLEVDASGNVIVKQRFLHLVVPSGTLSAVSGNTTSTFSIPAASVVVTDEVITITKPTTQAGLFIAGTKAGVGSITVQIANITGSSITPTVEDLLVLLWRA